MKNSYFMLLRQRPQFRYLWLAAVISFLGDWFNTIASIILINRYTDTGLAVGALFVARALPPFILGPIAGVVADRFNRKVVLIVTDVVRAFIVLGFLLVDRPERVWLIYALTIAQFMVSAFFEPAKAALLPTLVEGDDELLTANTLTSATWSAMLALGAAIGGFTAALFGVRVALIIDALTFFVSAGLLLKISGLTAVSLNIESNNSGWSDFVDGLRYVKNHWQIGVLTLVKALGQIGSADILIAIYSERIFPVGEEGATTLGLLFAAAGVGAVVGPLIGNALTDSSERQLQYAITVGFISMALGWVLFGWAPTLPWAMLGLFIRFMGGSLNWTYSSVLLQIKVSDRFLGRVFALDFGIFTLAMAVSVWATGSILDKTAVSPRQIAFILGIAGVTPVLFWIIFNRFTQSRSVSQDFT